MRAHSMRRRFGASIATLALLMCAIAVQFGHAPKAEAAVYSFCQNDQLGPNGYCDTGQTVPVYQAYAYGEHSVCIDIRPWSGLRRCSSGTNGVYSGVVTPETELGTPWIENNVATTNVVHGNYFTH